MGLGTRSKKAAAQYTNIPSTGYGTYNNWQPPADWPIMTCPAGGIQFIVNDLSLATYAFSATTVSGQPYQVNWGDGIIASYTSGTAAQHTYAVGTGKSCSLGYTTFVITITSSKAGIALKTWSIQSHNLATNPQYHGYLSAVFNTPSLTSIIWYTTAGGPHPLQLQSCIITYGAALTGLSLMYGYSLQSITLPPMPLLTTATSMFQYCYSLQSLTLPPMPLLTTATSMFSGCSSLQSITLPPMPLLTNATSMFQNCSSLQSITLPPMPLLTNATGMFNACYSLQSLTLPPMPLLTTATSMFQYCYSLQSITLPPMPLLTNATGMFNACYSLSNLTLTGGVTGGVFGGATPVQADSMLTSCEQLRNPSFPNTLFSVINAAGASGKPNRLQSLTFSPSSTFLYATPPQIDVAYTTMTAAQLNVLFTSLPSVSGGQVIRITGATGAGSCTQSIATNLGWTVNSTT
jgi:hypothetical protein